MTSITIDTKVCKKCNKEFPKKGKRIYCESCIDSYYDILKKNERNNRLDLKLRGVELSKNNAFSISDVPLPKFKWKITIKHPFSYKLSKNSIHKLGNGRIFIDKEFENNRDDITSKLKTALDNSKVNIISNKLWVGILVEKSNHKGDAINVLDGIADAIKKATNLDDNWYSIMYLDWSIVKDSPHIYITIAQENVKNSQVCSFCGRILEITGNFSVSKGLKSGYSRECNDCRKLKHLIKKEKSSKAE